MRTILSLLALFSLCGLRAQDYNASYGLESPGGEVNVHPTATSAATSQPGTDNRYLTRLNSWEQNGNIFSTAFTVPFAWINRQVFFRLEQASGEYDVRINGRKVAYNADGNAPAVINITKQVGEGRNLVEVIVTQPSPTALLESWREAPAPAIAGASIMSQPTMHIRDILVRTRMGEDGDASAEVAIVVKSDALNPRSSRIFYDLLSPAGRNAATGYKDITLDMRREDTVRFLARIPADSLWSAAQPTLYTLRVKTQHEGRDEEFVQIPLGFRAVTVEGKQMSINAQPVTLRVREVPGTIPQQEVEALRKEGYNTLKLLPGPVPEPLLDSCDRWGLYVIAQAPIDTRRSGESRKIGGNPSNDPRWKEAYLERTENNYHATKRHPSVIAFSLATRSTNGINLYESYLNLKRFGDERPLIYPDGGGEWNNDPLLTE